MTEQEDDDAWMEALSKVLNRVDQQLGKNVLVRYSAYEDDADGNPKDNLDKIAYNGTLVFFHPRCEFYGGPSSRDWQSPVLTNPTWMDLCEQANDLIITSNDHSHIFLETIEIQHTVMGVTFARLGMGS